MLTGVFSTLLVPETKGISLEELSRENQEGFMQRAYSAFLQDSTIYPSCLIDIYDLAPMTQIQVQDGIILPMREA